MEQQGLQRPHTVLSVNNGFLQWSTTAITGTTIWSFGTDGAVKLPDYGDDQTAVCLARAAQGIHNTGGRNPRNGIVTTRRGWSSSRSRRESAVLTTKTTESLPGT